MHLVNLKHSCGHRVEWVLHGTGRTCGPYIEALVKTPCFRCLASETRLEVARQIQDEIHPLPPAA